MLFGVTYCRAQMATVPALSCLPLAIEAGSTVRLTVSDSRAPATDWDMALVLNDSVHAPVVINATANGTEFALVITAGQSGSLDPGRYAYAYRFTAKTGTPPDVIIGDQGALTVLPGIDATATPTMAQQMVAACESALLKLNSGVNSSVNFNGQSFTKKQSKELHDQLLYWKAQVLNEQRRNEGLRGNCRADGAIGIDFERPHALPLPLIPGWRTY